MSSQTSRKIIVASVMAAVVGIGVVTFALRSHPVASVAQIPHPPTPVTEVPAATLRAADTPNSVDSVKSADELTTTTAGSSPAGDQKAGKSTEFAASDSEIPPK
jgi:hypothetical protein